MSVVSAITNFCGSGWASLLLLLWTICILAAPAEATDGEEDQVGIVVVAILNTDELGNKLRYPSSVYHDPVMDETYVVAGGEGKVVVYESNFFPTVSLGHGRGADAPRGLFIDKSGTLYLCQSNTGTSPGRLTVFNPAFFQEREITFTTMPDGETFVPRDLVIGLTGNHYIVGQNNRGLLVLDSEENFSHWLQPQDQIFDLEAIEAAAEKAKEGEALELTDTGMMLQEEMEDREGPLDMTGLLPEGLIPGTTGRGYTEDKETGLGPVKVVDVARDSAGHLYILSEETSRVYVYSPDEEFLFSFGQKGGSTGKMSRPKSLVIDEKKKAVYVVDYMRHTILIFDLGGKFMYEFGGLGGAPGWFQYPTGLALNREGHLLVADLFNQRVQVLDLQFENKNPLFRSPESDQSPPPKPLRDEADDFLQPSTSQDSGDEVDDILQPAPIGYPE